MVAFDETGQGYWDFIVENCSKDLCEAVQKEMNGKSAAKFVGVKKMEGLTYVYINMGYSFVIIEEILDFNNKVYIRRNSISTGQIEYLAEVIKNDQAN